jgi:hypothetical protein
LAIWVMNKMKKGDSKLLGCAVFICCATFLFSAQASGQEDGTALMLEMTPPESGNLNIVPGVHSYDRFAAVTLVATPKPGYQFVYWMGNVTDATTGTTTVFLDSPKMIIAVFERNKFETVGPDSDTVGGEGGGSGLIRSGEPMQSGGLSDSSPLGLGGKRQHYPQPPPEAPPTPVPEPVTVALFSAGFLMLAKSRRSGENITVKT